MLPQQELLLVYHRTFPSEAAGKRETQMEMQLKNFSAIVRKSHDKRQRDITLCKNQPLCVNASGNIPKCRKIKLTKGEELLIII
jgi:hypothetical protein